MKTLLLFLLFTFCVPICFAQRQLNGKVVDVLTGDTFVLETQSAKFNIRLQYVDAPEATQSLHDVVKSHLSQFILNKQVTVDIGVSSDGTYSGRVFSAGIDLSIQMLRDGAVWYSVPDGILQNTEEKSAYLSYERMARDEKRGVWSISDLRPAYELRLERERILKERLEAQIKELMKDAIA